MKRLLSVMVVVFMFLAGVSVADMQGDRQAFIQKLIKKGIIQKVEVPGKLPHVWVKPLFYALDFSDKQQFISVIYIYYKNQNSMYDIVVLYDSKSGKEIGKFAETYGGLKLY